MVENLKADKVQVFTLLRQDFNLLLVDVPWLIAGITQRPNNHSQSHSQYFGVWEVLLWLMHHKTVYSRGGPVGPTQQRQNMGNFVTHSNIFTVPGCTDKATFELNDSCHCYAISLQ